LLSKGNLGVKFCWSVTLHGKSLVCQALNLSGGQDLDDRFIRGFPEDQVDEHHGLEDSAQAAEAPVALVVRTSVRSYCARITELLATTLSIWQRADLLLVQLIMEAASCARWTAEGGCPHVVGAGCSLRDVARAGLPRNNGHLLKATFLLV
jgi:hypothetical protein